MTTIAQVCTLHQALLLRDAGILPVGIWYFTYYPNSNKQFIGTRKAAENQYGYNLKKYGDASVLEIVSAFTVSELAQMLAIEQGWLIAEKLAAEVLLQLQEGTLTVEMVNARLTKDWVVNE